MKSDMTRRTFLQQSSLVIAAAAFSNSVSLFNASPASSALNLPFRPHAFLEIATDNAVTVWVGQTNLGQGTHTGIPMIIADELDAAWETVQVKMALAAEPFKDPLWHAQVTGGSTSIRHRWDLLRKVGRPPGRCWRKRLPSNGEFPRSNMSPRMGASFIRTDAASPMVNWPKRPPGARFPPTRY